MTEESHRIELSVPARAEWLFLARTTGAAVASQWDFTYEEIADLRLAIDELCLDLVAAGTERIDIVYTFEDGLLSVTATAHDPGTGSGVLATHADGALNTINHDDSLIGPSTSDLSQRILDALVDEHGSGSGNSGGTRSAWLKKSRSALST